MLLDTHKDEIELILSRYASRRSAVLPLLFIAQDNYGYLSNDAIREVADILEMPDTDVFEVVGFYTLFYNQPVGSWMLQICDDVPCCYLGAEELISSLKQTLGIAENQTTDDGMFTMQRVKCLAACDRAPVVQANLDYIYDVTADKADDVLNNLRERAAEAHEHGVSGRNSDDYQFDENGKLHLIERMSTFAPRYAQPARAADEATKLKEEEAASVPEEPAKEEAQAEDEAKSPVAASPSGSSATAAPKPEAEGDAVPAQAAQQDAPEEKPRDEAVKEPDEED